MMSRRAKRGRQASPKCPRCGSASKRLYYRHDVPSGKWECRKCGKIIHEKVQVYRDP